MCKNRRRVVVAFVLVAVAGSVQPVRAQETKVPYYVAEVPFQLYETPPEPIPFFRFLLSSPDEKELVLDQGTNFLVLERRVINRLGEQSLWWRVEEMRATEEQQQGRPAGWIYAGFEPAGGMDDPNLNPWWSLEGVVDASEAGLKTSKTTGR